MTIVGIDLGTTFSAISVVREGKPIILPVRDARIMPSVVGYSPDGRWLVGKPALNQWGLYPEQTVRSIKRKMGTNETVLLGERTLTPPQISAMILQTLKNAAQEHLGETVTQAVITVPAFFSDIQRQATQEAGQIAGLEVMRIINEPTAAALAYGLEQESDELALVYDLGGGTFDVSLVEMSGGVVDVRASHGNTQLGGDDFDARLAQWLVEQFEDKHGVDLRGDQQSLARIRRAAEQAKIELSSAPFAWVREEYLTQKQGVPLHMEIEISRGQFIGLIDDLLVSTLDSVDRVLKDAKIDTPDHVMLVGGSTYIPAIWEMIAEHTGVEPRQDVNPSEAVALGAGIQGAIISGEPIDAILVDVTPFSLGMSVLGFTALGQPIEDQFKVLIHRNTTIPVTQREVFTALYADQREAKIEVYQGENPIASENTLLGEFMFEGLTPEAPGLAPRVTVNFDVGVNGMLVVTAVDRASGKEASITVKAAHQRLSQAEIASARYTLPEEYEDAVELPEYLLREAELLLARARMLKNSVLDEPITAVETAMHLGDEDEVRDALDALSDTLFDLEG